MKKILVATLLVTLTSFTNAQVNISGKVIKYIDNTDVNGNKSTTIVTAPTSNIALSVNEKFATDLTARAIVETSVNGNTIDGNGTKLGDRQTTLGVSSKFGSIDIGRNVHSHFLAITSNDVFGTLYGSVAGDVHNLRGLRLGDAAFVTVTPLQNVSVSYERSQDAVNGNANVYAANVEVAAINAAVARFENNSEKSTVVGLGANIMGFKVHYTFSDDQGTVSSRGHLVGLAQRFGNITTKASYGKTNTDVSAYSLGADYHFSKRTEVFVAYRNVNKAGISNDVAQIGLGLTHRF